MTQNEELCLNDYQARQKVERQKLLDEENEVFRIQNQALRVTRVECPLPLRMQEDCGQCGNENCVKAWKEQCKLWNEPEDQNLPALAARTTNTSIPAANSSLSVPQEKTTLPSQPHTLPVSGSNLFDLIQYDEEEAA